MGHEIAGEVVEVGDGVTGWSPGDRVQVIAAIPLRDVRLLPRRPLTVCPNQVSHGVRASTAGSRSTRSCPPRCSPWTVLNPIPEEQSASPRPPSPSPSPCAINAQEAHPTPTTATSWSSWGPDPIGCLHVRLARARGAAQVYLARLEPRSASTSPRTSSSRTPRSARPGGRPGDRPSFELTGGRGADVIITAAASGAGAGARPCRWSPRRGGSASSAACPRTGRRSRFDSNVVHYKELDHQGGQRVEPGPQQAGARDDRRRPECRCRTSSPTGCRSTRSWTASPSFQNGHRHQGHDRALSTTPTPHGK